MGPYGPINTKNQFSLFYRPSVYATKIAALPVNQHSAEWIQHLSEAAIAARPATGATMWRNFSQNNTGYQPKIIDSSTTTFRSLRCRTADGTRSYNGAALYHTGRPDRFIQPLEGWPLGTGDWRNSNGAFWDDGNGVPDCPIELSGGQPHPDSHVLLYDPNRGELWEIYQYDYNATTGDASAYMGKHYYVANGFFEWDGNTADESGQIIYPMLPKYTEIVGGVVHHAVRFNAPKEAVSNGYIWPARNAVFGGTPTWPGGPAFNLTPRYFAPMGAWIRLKAATDISGYRTDTQVYLQGLKDYGAILSDVGESMSMVGTSNEAWPAAMLAELRLVSLSDMEFIDSGYMSTASLKAQGDFPG